MPDRGDKAGGRGIPESLREAIEGAFAATERTRDRATEISGRTIDRAQDLVGVKLVAREELREIEERLDRLTRRVEELERDSGRERDG